jgi:hypothetical protein
MGEHREPSRVKHFLSDTKRRQVVEAKICLFFEEKGLLKI